MSCASNLLLAILLGVAATSVAADTVTLSNGDRLTGVIVNLSGDTLVLKTAYAGEIRIRRTDIATLSTAAPVTVLLDGRLVEARVRSDEAATATLQLDDGSVETIEMARLAYLNPTPQQGGPGIRYSGRANVGASRTDGNSSGQRLHADAEATARTRLYRWTAGGEHKRARDGDDVIESNWRLNGALDRFFTPRRFGYAKSSFERDTFRDISLRSTVGAGIGWQVLDTESLELALQGGLEYVNVDRIDQTDEDYPAAGWGVRYRHALWAGRMVVFHEQQGFWSLQDSRDVLVRSRTGLRFPLAAGIQATTQVNLDWDHQLAPGRESTDRTWLLTLGYQW
jgi:putative salt-induced outer membrane protein YdiY